MIQQAKGNFAIVIVENPVPNAKHTSNKRESQNELQDIFQWLNICTVALSGLYIYFNFIHVHPDIQFLAAIGSSIRSQQCFVHRY